MGLPEDGEGNKNILVVIDSFTRYVELYPCPDVNQKQTLEALLWITQEGTIRSRGQFVAAAVEELYEFVGLDPIYTLGYRPSANGQVERVNGEVMRHLRAVIQPRQSDLDWSQCLPIVRKIVNASVHSSTGVAPAEVNPDLTVGR